MNETNNKIVIFFFCKVSIIPTMSWKIGDRVFSVATPCA